MSVTTSDLADRYGSAGPGRRRAIILVSGLVGVALVAWVVWAAVVQGSPQVQSGLRSFTVPDDHTVRADVTVTTSSSDVKASCLLRAYGVDHSVVGELNFKVSGVKGTHDQQLSFRTERGATSVELIGCTAPGQNRPR